MATGLRVLAILPCFDEARRLPAVLERFSPGDEVLVVADGCTDASAAVARAHGARVLEQPRRGVGAAIRAGYQQALDEGFDVAVVLAANGKDDPRELPRLVEPIADGLADLVQGSRYLSRDAERGGMPAYRRLATRAHPWLFSAVAGRFVTESTNGFRAVHRRVLEAVDVSDAWLDGYGLEPTLYLRAVQQGFRTVEVPVTKRYPPRGEPFTKMPPITGWWRMLEPLVRVGLERRP
ncbi:MAG: glycosyltransferase family 2 protein [Myxococcota bacterium]